MKLTYVSPCALGFALALTVGGVSAIEAQVPVRKDTPVVREDPGIVERQVATVTVRADQETIGVGQTTQLHAEARAADGQTVFGREVTWRSENPEVATVTPEGRVTAVGPGTTTIVGTVNGQEARTTITVREGAEVTTVNVRADEQTLDIGETTQLRAEARGFDDMIIADPDVTWRSENPSVATVTQDGRVTAVSPGTATMVATVNGREGRTTITVREEAVEIAPPPITVRPAAFYWGLGGGVNFPQGALNDAYDRGWNITMPLGYDPIHTPWGARLDLSYNRLGGRTFAVGATQLETSAADVWAAMLNGTLRLPIGEAEGRSGPYAFGGVGLHHFRNFAIAAVEEPVQPGDPQFGQWTTDNTTRFGWNAGAGFAFGVGAASLFVESRFVSVNTPGRRANYVPVILGFTF